MRFLLRLFFSAILSVVRLCHKDDCNGLLGHKKSMFNSCLSVFLGLLAFFSK